MFLRDNINIDEEKLRLAIEAGTDGIWEWDLKNDQISFTGKWRNILGLLPDESLSYSFESWLEIIHNDDRELVRNIKIGCKDRTRKIHNIKFRILSKNGQYKWIVSRGQAICDEFNNIKSIIGAYTEISKSISIQEELIQSEKRYRNLIELLPNAIIVVDDKEIILFANSKAAKLFGINKRDYLIGMSLVNFISKELLPEAKKHYQNIKQGNGVTKLFEGKLLQHNKQHFDAELIVTKINFNETEAYLTIFKNISERKKIEEMLKKSYVELEGTLKKLQETQAQLVQQEKLAGIGQLAAGIAHEINNPLGFLLSNLNTLEKYFLRYNEILQLYQQQKERYKNNNLVDLETNFKQIDEIEKQYNLDLINEDLDDIFVDTNEGINRVSTIVKGLRLFSRVDSLGEFEQYDINEGLNSTLVVTNNEIKYYADVELELNSTSKIQAMGGAINQVLLNIIINAAYAIRTKKITELGLIKIKTSSKKGYVFCSIEDNGIGIEQDYLDKIFDPFFTTKPPGDGTGLGLSIAYDIIVNKHHGELKVESKIGIGTKFTIKIPEYQ